MRSLVIVVLTLVNIGLPLHAAITNPLIANWQQFVAEFLMVAAVLAVYTTAFAAAAVILDRLLSGQWIWAEDTVVLHRRSHHTTNRHVAYVPKSTSQLLHEYWNSEEGKAEYITWLAHK